ncbi:MAG: hypothetical protein USCGTAYLOR_03044 [Chromatiales bacterium USCg_Taylor]|nr:MAG: hypothetical protein USCGTAYLOR_03044 [Chromatiales bacterium USCg_Taylor]
MGPGKVAVWSKFCPSYALAINLAGDFSKHARQLLGQPFFSETALAVRAKPAKDPSRP